MYCLPLLAGQMDISTIQIVKEFKALLLYKLSCSPLLAGQMDLSTSQDSHRV